MSTKNWNKKGISPVIATVLLIVIVIVIAIIIFLWFRGFINEAIVKFDKNIELVCDDIQFSASYDQGTLQISNNGNVPIEKIKINRIRTESSDIIDLKNSRIKVGKMITAENVDCTGCIKMILIPILLGDAESGRKEFVCGEEYGIEIIM